MRTSIALATTAIIVAWATAYCASRTTWWHIGAAATVGALAHVVGRWMEERRRR